MPPKQRTFNVLEQAVLDAICEAYREDREILHSQISTAILKKRENTGCGFFTHFSVDRASTKPISGERLRNGPLVKVTGMRHGMGFILWLDDGYPNCLEGYAYGDDSTTKLDFENVAFEILEPGSGEG
ncbi:MAG TPA: hypothetical protein VMG31_03650 [Verrucomicrobiae bacterium]|nr:hypothetical protein [Verrucomicrobiae bacterium]